MFHFLFYIKIEIDEICMTPGSLLKMNKFFKAS